MDRQLFSFASMAVTTSDATVQSSNVGVTTAQSVPLGERNPAKDLQCDDYTHSRQAHTRRPLRDTWPGRGGRVLRNWGLSHVYAFSLSAFRIHPSDVTILLLNLQSTFQILLQSRASVSGLFT